MEVLIVDDDIATVEVIRDSIKWGMLGIDKVRIAYNVFGAKKILSDFEIDIVISDIEMPKESGIDLLRWARENKLVCEFLFLTCHESFSYASNAISYNAAAYLTKPFNPDIMDMNLQKLVTKLKQNQSLKKSNSWMKKNSRFLKQDFWKLILNQDLKDEYGIRREIESRQLNASIEKKYVLIYTKVTNIEDDVERYGKDVLEFALECFHTEILTGIIENESVIKFHNRNILKFITIHEKADRNSLRTMCEELLKACKGHFQCTITCCISDYYSIFDLAKTKEKIENLFDYNVSYYGKIFFEEEIMTPKDNKMYILDLDRLIEMVNKKDKTQILFYLKSIFDELSAIRNLNVHSLYLIKQEVIQVVYGDLMKQGIQATKLFYDEESIRVSKRAADSTVDMIRWVIHLLGKTFAYEEEVNKSTTIITKINYYIHEHYNEDIGRGVIAEEFCLTPEYLSKLYKKKTGQNLKDYIHQYRIDKAKVLLLNDELNVSEIAAAVGFDSLSYFSTIFKKYAGIAPKEYRCT